MYSGPLAFSVATTCVVVLLAACATLDEHAVARTDRVEEPPFYVDDARAATGDGKVLVLPVAVDEWTMREMTAPGRAVPWESLLMTFNERLEVHTCCRYLRQPALPASGAPWIYVGSATGASAPPEGETQVEEWHERPPMIVHIERPSADWRRALSDLAAREGAERIVLISVAVAEFPKSRAGFFGKQVWLGTEHSMPIRFLSAEDKPIDVLEFTGVVMDANGRVLRAGAEGILGADTPFWLQVFDVTRTIDDEALEKLLKDEHREDLPGAPLKWQVALDTLLEQLLTPS